MRDHKPTRTRPTGTPAQGSPSPALAVTRSCWDRLPRAVKCSPAAPKFLIVDAVPQHDEKTDQELAGHRDPRFGVPASAQEGEVQPLQVIVIPDGDGRGLHQDHTKQGTSLLGDRAEVPLVR